MQVNRLRDKIKVVDDSLNGYTMNEVLVFKPNAPQEVDHALVANQLSTLKGIKAWNFDLDDCDRMFRIVAEHISVEDIIQTLQSIGIKNEGLAD